MVRQKQPKKRVTAFCLPIITRILNEPCVVLVSNVGDAEVRRRLEATQTFFSTEGLHNKPAGWGLPGGGGEGAFETPKDIALKELGEETGLSEKPGTTPRQLGEPKLRTGRVSKNGDIVRMSKFYKDGQEPATHLNAAEAKTTTATKNAVYVFFVDIVWEKTKLQSLLRSVKRQLVESGYATEEDIQRDGVWVNFSELFPEAVAKLGIETREIDGIGVFPISLFANVNDPRDFPVPAAPDYPNFRIYPSHLIYAKDGLGELGLLAAEIPKEKLEAPEAEPEAETETAL